MNHNKIARDFSMLGTAVLASDVIDLIYNRLEQNEREPTVNKIKKFLESIDKGNKFISSGRIENRATQCIDTYGLALEAFSLQSGKEHYKPLLKKVKSEIQYIEKVSIVEKDKAKNILSLFENVRNVALSSVSSHPLN